VTTAEIARASGVAEGTIFRAFGDKESLIEACLHGALDPTEAIAAIDEAGAAPTLDARMTGAAEATMAHFRTALPLMHGTMRGGTPPPQSGPVVGEMFQGLLGAITELFAREVAGGEVVGDPVRLARMVVGVCQSTVWLELFSGGWTVEPAQGVSVLLDGCRAPRPPTS